jgi:pimeloyl-ACP methyl ester carboxylesterase
VGVVLIHGAWHGAWAWDGVVDALKEHGEQAIAVELPLTSFVDDVGAARDAISEAGPGAVVCGHSYGGLVISAAARGLPVGHLVYLAAFMVDEDEPWATVWRGTPTSLQAALVIDEDGTTVDPARVHECFYGDNSPELGQALASRLRPMPAPGASHIDQSSPAWREAPSTYVVCTRDRSIDPVTQRTMARHAGTVLEWDTDHSPFLTRPAEVAALIVDRARASPSAST